jgi:hypothetical protein
MSQTRSEDLTIKPAAEKWRDQYPDSARNLDRILDVLRHFYRGQSQGYINRASRIEYRFGKSEDEKRIRGVRILGNQGHIKVRFQFFQPRQQYPFKTKTLLDRDGNPTTHVVDLDLRPEDGLDALRRLMLLSKTFCLRKAGTRIQNTARVIAAASGARARRSIEAETAYDPRSEQEGKKMTLRAATVRLGQPKFRKKLLDYYQYKCLVSDCEVSAVLEAAHITPYNGRNTNKIGNGILLRADLHTLWDRILIAIDPKTFKVSIAKQVRSGDYAPLHGKIVDNNRLELASRALEAHWKSFQLARRKQP